MKSVSIALVHHPVLNKNNEVIGSAVTNLDLHDIARAAKTYGIENYYIITPYEDQQMLVKEIIGHWKTGHGATYNPARKEALSTIRLSDSVEAVVTELRQQYENDLLIVATSARASESTMKYIDLRNRIEAGTPVLLLFGTAHGLAPEIMETVDVVAEPLKGAAQYNHLSVRSAASIIFDRLLG